MLHDLFEGSLPSAREETLFHALATDEELRFEFKALLKMRDAVRDDDRAMAVPFSSTTQIFSRLGYMAPGVGAGAAAGSGVASFFRTFGTHTAAVVLGIVLASSWFLWVDTDPSNGNIATTSSTVQQVPPQQSLGYSVSPQKPSEQSSTLNLQASSIKNAPAAPSMQLLTSRGETTERAGGREATHGQKRTVALLNNSTANNPSANNNLAGVESDSTPLASEQNLHTQEALAENLHPVTDVELRSSSTTATISSPDSNVNLEAPALLSSSAVASASTGRSFRPDLRLGLRAVAPVHLSQPTQPLPTTDNLNNVTASLVVRGFSQNFAAVLEAGRESYVQKFDQLKSDGRIFHVEQAPSVLWGGIGLRYAIAPESTFNPFIQGIVGGSEAGPLVRSMIGLDWQFSRSAGITLGVDYSLLTFAFQDRAWYSQRIGVGGGLTFRLMED